MISAQFAIAKFIPDMMRMEPRNFGVVVWNRGECVGRFIGDDKANDGRSLSSLGVQDKHTYLQWLDYWRTLMGQASIRTKTGEEIPRTEPEFLDALCGTSRDNFRLNSAGFLSEVTPKSRTTDVVQSLFENLVLSRSSGRPVQGK